MRRVYSVFSQDPMLSQMPKVTLTLVLSKNTKPLHQLATLYCGLNNALVAYTIMKRATVFSTYNHLGKVSHLISMVKHVDSSLLAIHGWKLINWVLLGCINVEEARLITCAQMIIQPAVSNAKQTEGLILPLIRRRNFCVDKIHFYTPRKEFKLDLKV